MEKAGLKLKQARERLKLRYRDVEELSQKLAVSLGNPDYSIALSRLSDIENKGTVPTVFRLHSLCVIYRLELTEVLSWYGVPVREAAAAALQIPLGATHPLRNIPRDLPEDGPPQFEGVVDINNSTDYGGRLQRFARTGLAMLHGPEARHCSIGVIGMQDWFMAPLISPGSVVLIDERQRKVARSGWTDLNSRPIYFVELREGYCCGWASIQEDRMILQPHPASHCVPLIYNHPADAEVVGRVIGVATLLGSRPSPPPDIHHL